MLTSSSFVSAVLMLSSVNALPQAEEHKVFARVSCPSGSFINGTSCAVCPVGNFCDGSTKQKCDSGHYQTMTNSSSCLATVPGFYQPNKGANDAIPCPAGSYQPYAAQAFCYGAPKGRFQNLTGQAQVCGTCCGWAAPLNNFNTEAVNCSSTQNAYPSSGDGCRDASQVNCIRTLTCVQFSNGTCPIGSETFRG